MLEGLQYDISSTELHYLLRKFGATDDFDMLPQTSLTFREWMCLVGECQMLKDSYEHISPEAFEICYETMVQNLQLQRRAGLEGTDRWPHLEGQLKPPDAEGKTYFAPLEPKEEERLALAAESEAKAWRESKGLPPAKSSTTDR
mmetsp:Transcript_17856/g.41639  ORF Transcript_17856/g.41639 Transcript_17856/m.41639 type:complete len:144 (-) Transcript_17856:212-643(-)